MHARAHGQTGKHIECTGPVAWMASILKALISDDVTSIFF